MEAPDSPERMLCYCLGVRVGRVSQAIEAGAKSVEAVTKACKAGGGCRSCHPEIRALLQEFGKGGEAAGAKSPWSRLRNLFRSRS